MSAVYPQYTVSSLTAGLKHALESGFTRIIVEGEISGWRHYPSGHCYFTLKDSGAQLSAVMFAGPYEASCGKHPELREGLKDGAKVKLFGSITVYAPRGNYQLNVLSATLVGEGVLMQKYLELKAKLEKEGLFESSRKRRLPFLPRRIGIVTSEAGAVIHDMCTVLMRRFPNLEVRLFPSLVQGDTAAATIRAGVDYFNALTDWVPDLLIVARGGGSFEDLFCFNDEALVRAVAASKIPTISAIGHETDFTLCDFAADVRAGTPSIAAEIAVPVLADLISQISDFRSRQVNALTRRYEFCAQRVDHLSDALVPSLQAKVQGFERKLGLLSVALAPSLQSRLQSHERKIEVLSVSLGSAMKLRMSETAAKMQMLGEKLKAYSPYGVLDRGYSLTTDAEGRVVKSADDVTKGATIRTRLAKGEITSVVS